MMKGVSEVSQEAGSSEVVGMKRKKMSDDDDDKIMGAIPPCYRFCPYDYELIYIYLQKKLLGVPLPLNRINDVNLYSYSPEFLSKNFDPWGEQQWYFFTPRYRKYRNGSRPKREAGNGYWKATGKDNPILMEKKKIGSKKTLVFYQGKPSKGTKTVWVMNEFRVADNNTPPSLNSSMTDDCMRLDDWVLCKIHRKRDTGGKTKIRRKIVVPPILPTEPSESTESNLESINNIGLINQENNVEPRYDNTAMEPTQTTGELYHAPPETSFDQSSEPNYMNCFWDEGEQLLARYRPSNEMTWGDVYGANYVDTYSSAFSSSLANYGIGLGNHLHVELDAGCQLSSTEINNKSGILGSLRHQTTYQR